MLFFAIKGSDFEIATGFPNFWGWGLEDNVLNDRCLEKKLIIDRSQFYIINDKENIHPIVFNIYFLNYFHIHLSRIF